MIRLGLRLTLAGGREAIARLTIVAAAVAIGTLMLLSILAALNGFTTQDHRNHGLKGFTTPVAGSQPVLWRTTYDIYQGRDVGRFDAAATGPRSPVPPGIPSLPAPGEYYASPALAELLRTLPADQLADRFPGHQVGLIGNSVLPSPDTLAIIIGYRPDQLANAQWVRRITEFQSTCSNCGLGTRTAAIDLVLSVVIIGLLFPVLIFIATATRLNAARREERFAAMRLVGATPRQIAVLATVESTAAAILGTAVGFGLFALLRDRIASIPFTGDPFFPADLRLSLAEVLVIALGVPVAAALAARVALRRVRISPLGVTRRVTPRPPRAYRLIPLALGVAELAYFVGRRPESSDAQTLAYMPGFALIMAGLVIAGPWLTMVGARFLAGRARRPAALIAARRLADNPRAGFRAVSGLVIAVFVTSVAVGVITTINANRGPSAVSPAARATLTQSFEWQDPQHPGIPADADPVPAGLRGLSGVQSVTVIRGNPNFVPNNVSVPVNTSGPPVLDPKTMEGVVSCVDLASLPNFGRCAPGAQVVAVPWSDDLRTRGTPVWPDAGIAPDQLAHLRLLDIVVRTDGSPAVVERVRTLLELAYPTAPPPQLPREYANSFTNALTGWQQLANVIVIVSLGIAGAGLAVVIAGGLSERKRPFSLLRLTGVPLAALRRVVLLESGVPLILAALVASGAGFLAAHLFLRAQLDYSLLAPDPVYYVITGTGLLASLGIIASTLPMLRRISGPETARNG